MCEDAMVKKRSRKMYSAKELTIDKLEQIVWNEKYKADWKDIEKRQNDPNGNIKQREDREQYYVDNMTLDSRSASIVGKEQGEHYWRFAPQMIEYRHVILYTI